MSLMEVLLAGVLFFGSSGVSLLTWSRAMATLQDDGRRAEAMEGLEAEVQAAEIRLRDPALLALPNESCHQLLARVAMALEQQPVSPGVSRQVVWTSGSQALRLNLVAADLRRERSYDPAAFGGCALNPPEGS